MLSNIILTKKETKKWFRKKIEGGGELECRFYEAKYPEEGELVMVQVKSFSRSCVEVELLEYDKKIFGIIPKREILLKKFKFYSSGRLVNRRIPEHYPEVSTIGRKVVVVVLGRDIRRGKVLLSYRRAKDTHKCRERYLKGLVVKNIMISVMMKTGLSLYKLNRSIAWKLYNQTIGNEKIHALDVLVMAFSQSNDEDEDVLESFDIQWPSESVKQIFMETVKSKLAITKTKKIRAEVEVTCFSYEGIDAIKLALKAGEAVGTDSSPVKIRLISSPLYMIVTTCKKKEDGIQLLEKSINAIKQTISMYHGFLAVRMPPRCVSECRKNFQIEHENKILEDNSEEDNSEED